MLQIRAFKKPHRHTGIAIFIEESKDGVLFAAEPINMKTVDPKTLWEADGEPALTLPDESGQQLIDDLWNAGLRPSEGSGSAGALAAVQRHLGDMRRLVFDK